MTNTSDMYLWMLLNLIAFVKETCGSLP